MSSCTVKILHAIFSVEKTKFSFWHNKPITIRSEYMQFNLAPSAVKWPEASHNRFGLQNCREVTQTPT